MPAENVQALARSGELKSFKVRGQYRIRSADLEAYTGGDGTTIDS
ncbi:helix-turn-helix domain-containing protein [Limnoglobus roseus]|nr:helix-turn-helix domain-containing protein [Limnoglobus roseus]